MSTATKVLVVVGTCLRTTRDPREPPTIELTGEGGVLRLLVEVLREDVLLELLFTQDDEAAAMGEPIDGVVVGFLIEDLHQLYALVRSPIQLETCRQQFQSQDLHVGGR